MSFLHKVREDRRIHLEIGGGAYEINVDFGHWKKEELLFVFEFGHSMHFEASDDNLDARI